MTKFERLLIYTLGSLISLVGIIAKNLITEQGGAAGDFERVTKILDNTTDIVRTTSEEIP